MTESDAHIIVTNTFNRLPTNVKTLLKREAVFVSSILKRIFTEIQHAIKKVKKKTILKGFFCRSAPNTPLLCKTKSIWTPGSKLETIFNEYHNVHLGKILNIQQMLEKRVSTINNMSIRDKQAMR